MATVTRDISAFTSGLNVERFQSEMLATSFPSTPTVYQSVTSQLVGTDVVMNFTVPPDVTDLATMDGVIAAHSGTGLGLLTENAIVRGTQGGDLDGILPNCDVVAITDSGSTSHAVLALTANQFMMLDGAGNITSSASVSADELVKVTSDDTTSGYLFDKIVNSGAITLTEGTPGGDENLEVGLTYATPTDIGSANSAGSTDGSTVRSDHVHAHGAQGGGSQHALATTGTAGFMSAADKAVVDGIGPATAMVVFDHFLSSNEDVDELGLMGWRISTTGAGSDVDISAEGGHPGIIQLETGTATTGRAAIHLGGDSQPGTIIVSGTNEIFFECLVKFTSSISSADLEVGQVGLGVEVDDAGEFLNGVYVRFDPSVSSAFALVTANSGTRTASTGSTTVVIDTWYRVGFTISDPGGTPSAQMSINGTNEGSAITTNVPTATLAPALKVDGSGGANMQMRVDYYHLKQVTDLED